MLPFQISVSSESFAINSSGITPLVGPSLCYLGKAILCCIYSILLTWGARWVRHTKPSGKLSLESVWKKVRRFQKPLGRWLAATLLQLQYFFCRTSSLWGQNKRLVIIKLAPSYFLLFSNFKRLTLLSKLLWVTRNVLFFWGRVCDYSVFNSPVNPPNPPRHRKTPDSEWMKMFSSARLLHNISIYNTWWYTGCTACSLSKTERLPRFIYESNLKKDL